MDCHAKGAKRILIVLILSAISTAYFPFRSHPAAQILPERIHEEMYIAVGGIEQWITIKGDDRTNPILLFLHGGPGDALSPYADSMFQGWEKEFTLVQWDQRGAGRTYGKTGPSIKPTLTVERMTQDGIEVAEFLLKHLNERKIILEGNSWGSILGINMVHARSDLFYAYVGTAQLVKTRRNDAASYARVLEIARANDDKTAVEELTKMGPPPWVVFYKNWRIFRRILIAYQAKAATAPTVPEVISPDYASSAERAQYEAADDFCFEQFWGPTMSGPLELVDLPALGTVFKVPIYIIQGQEDLKALPEIAKAYFDQIDAPAKRFYLVPGTGHEFSVPELDLLRKVLNEEIRPLAVKDSSTRD